MLGKKPITVIFVNEWLEWKSSLDSEWRQSITKIHEFLNLENCCIKHGEIFKVCNWAHKKKRKFPGARNCR